MPQDPIHDLRHVPGLRRFDIARQHYPLMPIEAKSADGRDEEAKKGRKRKPRKGEDGEDGKPAPPMDLVARDSLSTTPRELIPSLGQYPTTPTWYYQTVAITDVSGEAPDDGPEQKPAGDAGAEPAEGGDAPDAPEEAAPGPTPVTEAFDPMAFAAATHGASVPAVGVLLKQAQTWTTAGLALGNLLHSVCLAPGEITQVAIIDWERTESGSQQESIDASDKQSSSSNQSRSIQEVTNAVMRETQEGSSRADSRSVSTQAGVGGALSFFAGSASKGSNHTVSTAVTRSTGSRDVAAESNQNVNAATTRAAEQVRSRRASVVREVRQTEHEQITTRVVANYNHCHTLNIEYFEVVEVFELVTRVVSAERCIFLPMKIVDFVADVSEATAINKKYCLRFREVLAQAAELIGEHALALAIRLLEVDAVETSDGNQEVVVSFSEDALGQLSTASTAAQSKLDASEKALDTASASVATIRQQVSAAIEAKNKAATEMASFAAHDTNAESAAFLAKQQAYDAASANVIDLQAQLAHAQGDRDRTGRAAQEAQRERDSAKAAVDVYERATPRYNNDFSGENVGYDLNKRQLYFSQAIWLSMGPAIIQEMVKGKKYMGETIADTIDPHPIAVDGNYLGFRWPYKDENSQKEFDRRYVKKDAPDATVAIPTGGVFAEGILGQAVSAEKIDSSLFWKWEEHDIPIKPTGIDNIKSGSRAQVMDLKGAAMEASGVSLPTLANLPDPAGLAGLYETIREGSVFRDMSGSEVIKSLAEQSVRLSSEGAKDAAEQATKTLDTVLKHQAKIIETLAPLIADAMAKKAGGGAGGGKLPIKDPTKDDPDEGDQDTEASSGSPRPGGFVEV